MSQKTFGLILKSGGAHQADLIARADACASDTLKSIHIPYTQARALSEADASAFILRGGMDPTEDHYETTVLRLRRLFDALYNVPDDIVYVVYNETRGDCRVAEKKENLMSYLGATHALLTASYRNSGADRVLKFHVLGDKPTMRKNKDRDPHGWAKGIYALADTAGHHENACKARALVMPVASCSLGRCNVPNTAYLEAGDETMVSVDFEGSHAAFDTVRVPEQAAIVLVRSLGADTNGREWDAVLVSPFVCAQPMPAASEFLVPGDMSIPVAAEVLSRCAAESVSSLFTGRPRPPLWKITARDVRELETAERLSNTKLVKGPVKCEHSFYVMFCSA